MLNAQLVGGFYKFGTLEAEVLTVSLEKIKEYEFAQAVAGRAMRYAKKGTLASVAGAAHGIVLAGFIALAGLEPAVSALRGRRVNQLHHSAKSEAIIKAWWREWQAHGGYHWAQTRRVM